MILYRYFPLERDVFASISDLPINSAADFDKYRSLLPRSYSQQYLQRRLDTEQLIRRIFIEKGGKPQTMHPHYLTLGPCDQWFFKEKHCFGSLVFDLDEFPPDTVSFTYGDSIPTFMDEFDDGKEYRKAVYTSHEIRELICRYKYPQDWNPWGELGPENYIEAQVWTDHPIRRYRPGSYPADGFSACIPQLAGRMMRARNFSTQNQWEFRQCIESAMSSPWWPWFCKAIRRADPADFLPDPVHGIVHGYKCALMALVWASLAALNEWDSKTLVLAALYHDIGRTRRIAGRTHGQIGAELVWEHIDPSEHIHPNELAEAIALHDAPEGPHNNAALFRLKDIDTLDYLRLGFGIYNPGYLRLEESRRLIRFALELNIHTYLDPTIILKIANEEPYNEIEHA